MIADILQEHLDGKPKYSKCLVGKWLETQDDKVNTLFEQLKAKPSINVAGLYRDLRSLELSFQLTTFKAHMKGNCTCPKA
jgi:hypothetical protein